MKDNLKYGGKIKRNILNGTLDMSAVLFNFMMDFGEMTMEAFLKPSLYAELPANNISFSMQDKKPKEATIRQAISRMEKHGFIKKEDNKYLLTLAGNNITKYIFKRKNIFKKKWDKKYRVVIFDIPEKKKHLRNWLRDELSILKYKQLQKSVFVGKFSLTEDLLKEIKSKKLNKFIDYLLVEKIYSKLKK